MREFCRLYIGNKTLLVFLEYSLRRKPGAASVSSSAGINYTNTASNNSLPFDIMSKLLTQMFLLKVMNISGFLLTV
jgi:hypothetical protein